MIFQPNTVMNNNTSRRSGHHRPASLIQTGNIVIAAIYAQAHNNIITQLILIESITIFLKFCRVMNSVVFIW